MSGRACCVVGCRNNAIKTWKNKICHLHNINYGLGKCVCLLPFVHIPFPTKDIETRNEWIKRVNRKGWQPNEDSRISSAHFVDFDLLERKPSPLHPYPTLHMRCELTVKQEKAVK